MTLEEPTDERVSSRDGTTIGFRSIGEGPGVVLVHGAMQSAASFGMLSRALAPSFRVHVIDRRGRGRSGGHRDDHGLDTEIEDLDALLDETGARFVFGLSSGACIALAAAQKGSTIDRVVAYEPPFTIEGWNPAAWAERYEKEIARGATRRALVTALEGTADRGFLSRAPRALLVPVAAAILAIDARRPRDGVTPMRDLVPTVRYDIRVQRESTSRLHAIEAVRTPMLLMGGELSHPSLRASLAAFASRVPHAERIELSGVGHIAADDVGKPKLVARELTRFFGAANS